MFLGICKVAAAAGLCINSGSLWLLLRRRGRASLFHHLLKILVGKINQTGIRE